MRGIPPRGSIPPRTTMRDVLAKRVQPARRSGNSVPAHEIRYNEHGGRIVNAADLFTPHEEGRGGAPSGIRAW